MTNARRLTAHLLSMPAPGPRYERREIPGFPTMAEVDAAIAASNQLSAPGHRAPRTTGTIPAEILAELAPADWLTRALARKA